MASYRVISVYTILSCCSGSWSIEPTHGNCIEPTDVVFMPHLERIGYRGAVPPGVCIPHWEMPDTHLRDLTTYWRLRWLENFCKMPDEILPNRIVFGIFADHHKRPPRKTINVV